MIVEPTFGMLIVFNLPDPFLFTPTRACVCVCVVVVLAAVRFRPWLVFYCYLKKTKAERKAGVVFFAPPSKQIFFFKMHRFLLTPHTDLN